MKRVWIAVALLGAFGLSACADTYGYGGPRYGGYYNQGYGPGYYSNGGYGYGSDGYYRGDGDEDDGPYR